MHGKSEGEAYLDLRTCVYSNVAVSSVLIQCSSWKYQGYYILTVGPLFSCSVFLFFCFWGCFLNSCGCSTAKSKTPSQETIFFTHLPVPRFCSLTTSERELVSVLEVSIEPGDLNPRPLNQQSVTLPTLPRDGWYQSLSTNGQQWAKAIIHCVGHVIVRCDNNSTQCFEWPYVVPFYSSFCWYKSRSFWNCVYKFLQCLIKLCVFPVLQFY